MITNDVLRSVRYMLDLSDAHVINLMKMADGDSDAVESSPTEASPTEASPFEVKPEDVAAWLKKEDEDGFVECPPLALAHFLDGLVIFRRGKNENAPTNTPTTAASHNIKNSTINNNVVLKKLRVAFELKEENLHEIMEAAGFKISKPEFSALFRKKGHKNYRACGDQFLRNFLKGLTLCIRG